MGTTILGISGSLRAGSLNAAALRAASELAPSHVHIEVAGVEAIPLYSADVEAAGLPGPVVALAQRIRQADAVLIATPEYNYSVPGVLKNAIDWLSRPPRTNPFSGKVVGILGAGGRVGTARAQAHLRYILGALNALVLPRPELLIFHASTKFDADGRLNDESTRQEIAAYLDALVALAARHNAAP
jgi:chromate reductase